MSNAVTAERQHVRVLYDVLTGLVDELDQTADEADLRAHLIHRQRLAHAQLIRRTGTDLRPVVLDPTHLIGHMSRQGQPLTPVITTETATTSDLSSAVVRMPPHHASLAHVHHHTG